jgi:ketosteroid isomerase-like protein
MTPEEQLIHRYFDAFNRHDIEGVMACFHDHPVIVDGEGRRFAGREEVRRSYETSFAPYGRVLGMTAGAWPSRCFTAPVGERERS